jgi:hypothetical protein
MDQGSFSDRESGRQGVYLIRGLVLCGLVLTAGSAQSGLHAAFRATLPLMAGLVFGVALRDVARTSGKVALLWGLNLGGLWLLTLSPMVWGDPDVLRTCVVSGIMGLLVSLGGWTRRVAWAAVALVVALALLTASLPPWARAAVGELQYMLGGAWPRGWAEISRDAMLFLLGSWAAGRRGIAVAGTWRGIADPLRALGRMPLTAAAGQYALAILSLRSGIDGGEPVWFRTALIDAGLLAQLVFATWWLRERQRGPCEEVLNTLHEAHRTGLRFLVDRLRSTGTLGAG